MKYWFLMLGAVLSLAGMVSHGFIGGKIYMGKVNKSDLEPLTKSFSLISWLIFTIFLFVSAVTLSYSAYNSGFVIAVYPVIVVNLLGAVLFLLLGLGKHRILLLMPGVYLMGATALLGWFGIS
jgi:hypothetical protein